MNVILILKCKANELSKLDEFMKEKKERRISSVPVVPDHFLSRTVSLVKSHRSLWGRMEKEGPCKFSQGSPAPPLHSTGPGSVNWFRSESSLD